MLIQHQQCQRQCWYSISSVRDSVDTASTVSETVLIQHQLRPRQCWYSISSVRDNVDTASAVSETMLIQHQQCQRQCWYSISSVRDNVDTASTVSETVLIQHQQCQRQCWYSISSVRDSVDTASTVTETVLIQHQQCQRKCWYSTSSVRYSVDTTSTAFETVLIQHQQCQRQCWYSISSFRDNVDTASTVSETVLVQHQQCQTQCWYSINSVRENVDTAPAVSETALMWSSGVVDSANVALAMSLTYTVKSETDLRWWKWKQKFPNNSVLYPTKTKVVSRDESFLNFKYILSPLKRHYLKKTCATNRYSPIAIESTWNCSPNMKWELHQLFLRQYVSDSAESCTFLKTIANAKKIELSFSSKIRFQVGASLPKERPKNLARHYIYLIFDFKTLHLAANSVSLQKKVTLDLDALCNCHVLLKILILDHQRSNCLQMSLLNRKIYLNTSCDIHYFMTRLVIGGLFRVNRIYVWLNKYIYIHHLCMYFKKYNLSVRRTGLEIKYKYVRGTYNEKKHL